jgi:hypothetical protein
MTFKVETKQGGYYLIVARSAEAAKARATKYTRAESIIGVERQVPAEWRAGHGVRVERIERVEREQRERERDRISAA